MKRYVVFVTTQYAMIILTSFREWREKTEFIISPNHYNEPIFNGIDTYKPDELTPEMFGDAPIAFLDDYATSFDRQSLDYLTKSKTRFVTRGQWVVEMLEDPSVLLTPNSVRLDICTRCQLNCPACYMRIDKKETTGTGHVTPSQFEAFLDRNPFVRNIEISNSGEPFVHPQIHEILEIAHKHDIALTCFNGSNFNHVSDQTLEALVDFDVKQINIALDGACQETYSIYRRNGNFDKVVANIRKLNEIKKRKKSNLPKLVWQFIVMSHNYDDVPRAVKMAKELDMSISFRDTFDLAEKSRLEKMLSEREAEHDEAVARNSKMIEANKSVFYSWCRDLLVYPQINWDGRLLGCCQVYRSDWGVNVFDRGLTETLNSDLYRKNLLALLKAEPLPYPETPCGDCAHRPTTVEEAEYRMTLTYSPV